MNGPLLIILLPPEKLLDSTGTGRIPVRPHRSGSFPIGAKRKSRFSGGFSRGPADETSTRRRWLFVGSAGLSLYRADTCHRHGHYREQREEKHHTMDFFMAASLPTVIILFLCLLINATPGRIREAGRNRNKASLPRVRFLPFPRLATSRYPASEKAKRERAEIFRDLAAYKMAPAQIAEAQRMAREWKPKMSFR